MYDSLFKTSRFCFEMGQGKYSLLQSSDLDQNFHFKTSLVAVLVIVFNVLAISLALYTELTANCEVGKLNCHKGLEVLGLQQLSVIGVVL